MIAPFSLLLILILVHTALEIVLAPGPATTGHRLRRAALALAHGIAVMLAVALLAGQPLLAVVAGVCALGSRQLLDIIARTSAEPSLRSRLLVQASQLAVLLSIWLTSTGLWAALPDWLNATLSDRTLLIALAYLLVFTPTSRLIGSLLKPWQAGLGPNDSLVNGGAFVGYLERGLILTFVLLDQWQAVGFLLTAKSILRFNELKGSDQQQRSEYVLLGTLSSFAASVGIGLATRLLGHF